MNNKVIKLTINTGNAAFGETPEEQTQEVIALLKRAIQKLEEEQNIYRFSLLDSFGNRVGEFTYNYH